MATPLLKRFYQDRFLQMRSFALCFLTICAATLALFNLMPASHYAFAPEAWHLLLVPLAVYVGGVSAVWIHNATHGSFSPKWLNWVCGQIAGIHQLWGFTGWKLIHLLHHMYSDDEKLDTHPPKGMSLWQFGKIMFVYSSQQVSSRYREHWGDTPETRLIQQLGLAVFLAMAAVNLLFWFALLGANGFVFFFMPSYITNHLLFIDINYSAHPADPKTGETRPANLNHTPYYKLANFLWSGIYFHGNHHRKPLLFNPRHMPARAPRAEEEAIKEAA
ncbi:MAG: fatty acid desaturase [Rickettsiales bacterium]|jgi:fatty acid desaturase|nr:fatty acid desaturase [Rickettsiales bacterium]